MLSNAVHALHLAGLLKLYSRSLKQPRSARPQVRESLQCPLWL